MTPNLLHLAQTTRRPITLQGGRRCLPLGQIHERTLALTWGDGGPRLEYADDLANEIGEYLPEIAPLAGQGFTGTDAYEAIGQMILRPEMRCFMSYRKQDGEEWSRFVCNLAVYSGKTHTDQFTGVYAPGEQGEGIKRTFKLEGTRSVALTGKLVWIPAKGIYEVSI